uniref:Uncharacterized protein n=1 Tax=Panagrolaimus sp. JU765 TaxID=591449 RepID=A0AC34QHZ7_9BILA
MTLETLELNSELTRIILQCLIQLFPALFYCFSISIIPFLFCGTKKKKNDEPKTVNQQTTLLTTAGNESTTDARRRAAETVTTRQESTTKQDTISRPEKSKAKDMELTGTGTTASGPSMPEVKEDKSEGPETVPKKIEPISPAEKKQLEEIKKEVKEDKSEGPETVPKKIEPISPAEKKQLEEIKKGKHADPERDDTLVGMECDWGVGEVNYKGDRKRKRSRKKK